MYMSERWAVVLFLVAVACVICTFVVLFVTTGRPDDLQMLTFRRYQVKSQTYFQNKAFVSCVVKTTKTIDFKDCVSYNLVLYAVTADQLGYSRPQLDDWVYSRVPPPPVSGGTQVLTLRPGQYTVWDQEARGDLHVRVVST